MRRGDKTPRTRSRERGSRKARGLSEFLEHRAVRKKELEEGAEGQGENL